jgi:hypothetical protein
MSKYMIEILFQTQTPVPPPPADIYGQSLPIIYGAALIVAIIVIAWWFIRRRMKTI